MSQDSNYLSYFDMEERYEMELHIYILLTYINI